MVRTIVTLLVVAIVSIGVWLYIVFGPKKEARVAASDQSSGAISKDGGDDKKGAGVGFVSTFDPDKELQANELIVVNPPANFTDVMKRLNYTVIERYTFQGLGFAVARLRVPSGMALAQARAQLGSELPGIAIDFNHRYDASQDPRRPGQATGSAADQLKKGGKIMSLAQAAIGWHDVPATCGKGIRLGMIDSSVDVSHPVLKGQDIEFRSFHGADSSPGDNEHGTAVAALLVGKPAESGLGGLLPGASLKAANMFERSSTGANVGNVVSLLRGLDWLVREKVQVINMSIAGSDNVALERGIAAASERSIIVVAAAGNWGRADKPAYPAAIEPVFAVTAIDSYQGIYEHANKGAYIDFAAPGVNLLTAAPGGGSTRQSGTSFAAPFLTAILALEIANGKGSNSAALQAGLAKLSRDLGPNGKDATYGIGAIQMTPKCPV